MIKLISVIPLLSLISLISACSAQDTPTPQPPSPTPIVIRSTNTPTPNPARLAERALTRTAFMATVSAEIDSTAYAIATRVATLTRTPTSTPTREPLPPPFTPAAAVLASAEIHGPASETLADSMVRTFIQSGYSEAFYFCEYPYNFFGIEIVKDSIPPAWKTITGITNGSESLTVFFSSPPEPTPNSSATPSLDEYSEWPSAKKMLIKDLNTGEVYWVKWEDLIPWRPITLQRWMTDDIFIFSQFANPWHGFLTAIDARRHKFLQTLQLEY